MSRWSVSAFADWVRGTPKPNALTIPGWSNWKKQAESAHPIRYWLVEVFFDKVQEVVEWPTAQFTNLRYYINNRYISKTHALVASPDHIKPGSWVDVGHRFLPCLFDSLVDFVEVEKAWSHVMWDEEAKQKYQVPWYRSGRLRLRIWRCPEAGISLLEWEAGLQKGTDYQLNSNDPEYYEPTPQALAAREVLELYRWYKEIYHSRPDPMEASGWTEYCRLCDEQGVGILSGKRQSKELQDMSDKVHARMTEMERSFAQEDELMMIRLIRLRDRLYT